MATGSPVSFWYGTRAQFDSITTKLDTTLYFITDEQALYKGTVKFSGSGVDTLLTVSATTPSASSVTTGDKYFDTSDNLIHVLKNEDGTVTTTATYEPANGALYYNADAQRFQTLVKDGSSYVPTEIYDAGISVEDGTGLILNGTTVGGLDATTNSKGVVRVGANLNVSNGVISAPTASTSTPGVVQLVNDASSSDMGSQTRAITPHAVGQVADGLNQEINTKQDNLSNGNVTTLNTTGGVKIDVNVGDGLDVGVAGSTNANKLIANEATVEETLTDSRKVTVEETTTTVTPITDRVVEPHDLKGALSVGQAVDVSCKPAIAYGTLQNAATNEPLDDANYLEPIRLTHTAESTQRAVSFGFGVSSGTSFPKYASGLRYLFIADVTVETNSSPVVMRSSVYESAITPIPTTVLNPGDSARIALTFNTAAINTYFIASVNNAYSLILSNVRQYEVTALTDEAIAYIAQLEDPDAFFRSTSAYSIRNKYLIKQDMVCPFIPTINMPDNSAGLTVGAGLSYQIKYTKTGTYSVSVDTIPADAYGWDAHISMFVKDTAVVQFQAPLILMDALTPNAGHNLSVKFRNGNALVYVDDTNAGTVVYLATGTTTTKGSLPYALSQTPTSVDATFTNFVVFSPVLGGTVCSMGNMSNVAYSASLIGNDDDSTIVGGTIGLASGKYLAVQDINLNDVEITSGTLNIGNNVKVTGTTTNGVVCSGTGAIKLDETCLLDFSDQTNNVPITGASISAVSGARAIPYGETESEAIVAGTGNAVNKYGKCGFLVSDTGATTASNTLYNALVGNNTHSTIIFDIPQSGTTFSTSQISSAIGAKTIDGNGRDITKIKLAVTKGIASSLSIKNVSVEPGTSMGAFTLKSIENCNITGVQSAFTSATNGGVISCRVAPATVTGSTFTNCDATYANRGFIEGGILSNCTFVNCGSRFAYSQWGYTVTNCTFIDTGLTEYAARNATQPHSTISGCTFSRTTSANTLYCYGGSLPGSVVVENCSFNANAIIVGQGLTINGSVDFKGTIKLDSTVSKMVLCTLLNGLTLDLSENAHSVAISAATISVAAGSTVTVIPYQGTEENAVVIVGATTGTALSNLGVLS